MAAACCKTEFDGQLDEVNPNPNLNSNPNATPNPGLERLKTNLNRNPKPNPNPHYKLGQVKLREMLAMLGMRYDKYEIGRVLGDRRGRMEYKEFVKVMLAGYYKGMLLVPDNHGGESIDISHVPEAPS